MENGEFTALVSGSGPAGLAASILLAMDGVKTAVIAPLPNDDPRTTALMQPSMQMLKFMGVWNDDLKSHCAPLKQLHMIDDTGNMITAPALAFHASEMELEEFGWNVPLAVLVPILRAKATALDVDFIEGESLSAECFDDHISVEITNGRRIYAKVLLAADGAESALRKSLGFTTENWAFNQSALATSFSHTSPHQNVSTEYHKRAGPFTTVPLPGNRSSLVWMDRPTPIENLSAMSDADLATEIQLETKGSLGKIFAIGPRKVFPMRGQRVTRFASKRCMVIGEAAHLLPPIGAQGLNLSLRDSAQAADLIIGAKDPGAETVLKDYDRLRRADVLPRQQIVNLMNTSLLSSFPAMSVARTVGLSALSNIAPLRKYAIQLGLAPSANLPFAMRG